MRLQTRGVNQLELGEAVVGVAEQAGVLPDGFYATTNLETRVCLGGVWYDVENPEMGCGLVVTDAPAGGIRVRTVPMSEVEMGSCTPSSRTASGTSWSPRSATTVTRTADRGSNHGRGIVTDVGVLLEQLALELVPDYRRV